MDFAGRMTTAEAGAYLGKSRHWVQTNWRIEGIPSFQIGGEFFFLKEDLDAYVMSKRIEPANYKAKVSYTAGPVKVKLAG